MPSSCDHLDIGCCEPCAQAWNAARADMARHEAMFDRPGRDIPYDREFPDSDAWLDRDGTIHYGDRST